MLGRRKPHTSHSSASLSRGASDANRTSPPMLSERQAGLQGLLKARALMTLGPAGPLQHAQSEEVPVGQEQQHLSGSGVSSAASAPLPPSRMAAGRSRAHSSSLPLQVRSLQKA